MTALQAQSVVLWCKHAPRSMKCCPMAPNLCLNPYSGLSDLFVTEKALAQYPVLKTGPFGPSWGKKEQTVSVDAPLVLETVVSQNSGIVSSRGNPFSHVQAFDNGSI